MATEGRSPSLFEALKTLAIACFPMGFPNKILGTGFVSAPTAASKRFPLIGLTALSPLAAQIF
jgi:hypothetical protein